MSAITTGPRDKKRWPPQGTQQLKEAWSVVRITSNACREMCCTFECYLFYNSERGETEKSCAVSSGGHYELKVCRKDKEIKQQMRFLFFVLNQITITWITAFLSFTGTSNSLTGTHLKSEYPVTWKVLKQHWQMITFSTGPQRLDYSTSTWDLRIFQANLIFHWLY